MTASSATMIGRDAELAWLGELLDEARAGMPRTVVIGGEAGIGKSRLIREFSARARGEGGGGAGAPGTARVLFGQCVDLGTVAAPYAPIKAALRTLVADVGAERVLDVVGPGRAAFVALLPELAEAAGPADAPGVVGGAGASGQLHEAVAVLLETIAREQPLVLIVEDLHWIDPASLAMLRFLVRMLTASRVMLVLSYRSEDVTRGHLLRPFLAELERDRWAARRELARLSRDEVRELAVSLAGVAPADPVLDTLFRRSDGVPFFVEEVVGLDGCRDEGELPDTLRELLLARYERLSDGAQQLLRLIATGGVRVGHPMLTEVFRGGDDELDLAAREAVQGGVLVVDGEDYGFRHALVREAIVSDSLPGERARFHARYAEAYEAIAARGNRRVAAEISFHWLGANDAIRAFPATVQAVREARAASAFASAAQLGERALALWDVVPDAEAVAGMSRIELMGRTASYARNAGEIDRSLSVVKAAIAECPHDDLNYPRLLRDKALTLANAGRSGSIPLLVEALEALDGLEQLDAPPARDDLEDLRASVLAALGGRYMIAGRMRDAIEAAARAEQLAASTGAYRTESIAQNVAAVSMAHLDNPDAGLEGLEQARATARDDGAAMLRYWVNASDLHNLIGDYELAIQHAEEGIARARATGLERSTGVILASNAVDPLFALGRWQRGLELIDRGLALDPPAPFKVYLWRARIWAEIWRGDVDVAEREFRAVRSAMTALAEIEVQTKLGVGRVATELALARGDLVGAWREASALFDGERIAIAGYGLPFAWAVSRVVAAARTGVSAADAGEAAELARA
ncbi:ATP-binding protein, partial [Agromyces soli]